MAFKTGKNAYLNNEDLEKIESAIDKIIEKQNIIEIQRYKKFTKIYPEKKYKKNKILNLKSKIILDNI
jgi:hypothetical protein